ncbi:hypothetical protein P3S68_030697 [Capsicum galapagoense]
MDLNFGFCVLLSLILLVACGTKARKIVEGNAESLFISQDNHQEALKAIYGSDYKFKQGAEDKYQQEISGLNVPILYITSSMGMPRELKKYINQRFLLL